MNISTIKDAIIGSVSKYEGQPITETILIKIQQDLYDLAKPIGKAGSITLEYEDDVLSHEQWVLTTLFFLLCLKWTPTLTVTDPNETFTVTDCEILSRLDDDFQITIGNVHIFVKDGAICMKRA